MWRVLMRFAGLKYFLLAILIILATGCTGSGGGTTPDPVDPPVVLNHRMLGIWNAKLDFTELSAVLEKDKVYTQQYPVIAWLDQPELAVNSWDPESRILDMDITLTNNFPVDAFDVRLIVYETRDGLLLQNSDQWTRLFAPDEVEPVNPYRIYAGDTEKHTFKSAESYTENFLIYIPENIENFSFAILGSYPGNCEEPYLIENFVQELMYPEWRCMAYMQIDVYDWQSDTSEVYLSCKEITGLTMVPFQQVDPDTWGLSVNNNMAAKPGTYNAVIMAKSVNSGPVVCYDFVQIEVAQDTNPPHWISTVGIESAAAGDGKITTYCGLAKDSESPNAVKYLIYIDTDDNPWDQVPVERPRPEAYTFTGLTNGVTYYLGIRVCDDADPPNIDTNTVVLARRPMPET
jgi:hypothetical protein